MTAKIENTATKYLYDWWDIVMEMDSDGVPTVFYVHGPGVDEPLARIDLSTGAIRYYHADALGSIIALTDENGTIKTRYNYTPFGEPEIIGEASDNPFMFAAREYDPETGLLHERNRDYSWKLGRYISEDPIGLAGGDVNFYARVGNNPVNFTDPWGLRPPTEGEKKILGEIYQDRMYVPLDLLDIQPTTGEGGYQKDYTIYIPEAMYSEDISMDSIVNNRATLVHETYHSWFLYRFGRNGFYLYEKLLERGNTKVNDQIKADPCPTKSIYDYFGEDPAYIIERYYIYTQMGISGEILNKYISIIYGNE